MERSLSRNASTRERERLPQLSEMKKEFRAQEGTDVIPVLNFGSPVEADEVALMVDDFIDAKKNIIRATLEEWVAIGSF